MRTDGLRLAVGTFTRIPIPAPVSVDRRAARGAMLLSTPIALLLGLVIGIAAQVLVNLTATPGLLAALLAIGLLAWITRALHLDGLADTADALGSGREATGALEIARRSDIGPFGVITLIVVLLAQVIAFAALLDTGAGGGSLLIALVVGRVAMMLATTPRVPAARPDGLGALVAGTVPAWAAMLIGLGWLTLFTGSVIRAHGAAAGLGTAASILGGVAVGWWLTRLAVRRLGGITGDVLGAVCEATTATVLVLLVVT